MLSKWFNELPSDLRITIVVLIALVAVNAYLVFRSWWRGNEALEKPDPGAEDEWWWRTK